MQSTTPKQSRATGAIALMIAQAIVLMFGYVTHLWIGRVLGPGPYGIYGVVLSVQTVLGIFLTLGVPSAVSRFVAQDEAHARSILQQALKLQVYIATGLAVATALFAPVIARLLQDASLTPYVLFVAVVMFTQAFYPIFVQFFSGLHRFNRQALLTSIYATAKLVGAIGLIYTFGVFGAFSGFAIGGIVAAGLGWWWVRHIPRDGSAHLSRKAFLSFAGMYVVILAGLQLLMSLDLFLVKALLQSDVQAGYYNAAVTLSRISYFVLQGLAFIILPSVSALTAPGASREQAVVFIRKMLRYLIALIVPAITIAAATSKGLITLFFSAQYLPAARPLTILMLGLGALGFFLLLANMAAGADKAKVALSLTIGMLIVSSALGLFLIPRFGLIGAAWQTTTASFLGLISLGAYIFWVFRIPFPYRTGVNVVLATSAAVLPTYIWKATSLLLIPQYVLLLTIYALVLWLLREISRDDIEQIARLHPRLSFLARVKWLGL